MYLINQQEIKILIVSYLFQRVFVILRSLFYMEKIMKKLMILFLLVTFPFWISASTIALYQCELLDGKNIDEVKEVNSKWVKKVNEISDGQITSQVLQPVVSSNMNSFSFIDTYEDEVAWSLVRREIRLGNLQEIDDAFDALSKCSAVSLHDSETS